MKVHMGPLLHVVCPHARVLLCCKAHVQSSCLQVSYSAILFYGYVGVIGLAVWSALRYFKSSVSLSQIWCTYGALMLHNERGSVSKPILPSFATAGVAMLMLAQGNC